MNRYRTLCVLLTAAFLTRPTTAHDQIPGKKPGMPIVIRGAIVHTVDGAVIDGGTVTIDGGKITAVAEITVVDANADVSAGMMVIDANGKHVYPGLFESISDIGLREINAVEQTVDSTELGSVNPNVRSWVAVNPDSELIPVTRAAGVLLALTAPRGKWIRGQAAVLQLDGWTVNEMTLAAPAGMYVDWRYTRPSRSSAKDRIANEEERLAELDDLLRRVRRYRDTRSSSKNKTSVNTDVRLASLIPLADGDMPLIAQADDQATIESAVLFAVRNDLKLIVYGGYDAVECADLLKKHDVPVIVASTHRLPRRRNDAYDTAYTLPVRLRNAGVRFAIGGSGAGSPQGASNARNLPLHAATAVAFGLNREEAIRAITLSPAEIMGVDDRVGSITIGKDATLIITDGDILETKTHVTHAFIQGRPVDLGSRHKTLYQKYQMKYK